MRDDYPAEYPENFRDVLRCVVHLKKETLRFTAGVLIFLYSNA